MSRRRRVDIRRWWPYAASTLFAIAILVLSGSAPWFTTTALVVVGACSMLLLHGYCQALETGGATAKGRSPATGPR